MDSDPDSPICDKRQLSYKILANSIYGQTGAKTSSFYEMDIAASTTAGGRMMLMYAKRMLELLTSTESLTFQDTDLSRLMRNTFTEIRIQCSSHST